MSNPRHPTRDATITRSDGEVVIQTYPIRPVMGLVGWIWFVVSWICFGIFLLTSVAPVETEGVLRVFAGFFVLLWFFAGALFARHEFRRVISRLEVIANSKGITLTRRSRLGTKTKQLPWEDIEFVSEFGSEGQAHGGVTCVFKGRYITLDRSLSNQVCAEIREAINDFLVN